jgi:hypothetical protein
MSHEPYSRLESLHPPEGRPSRSLTSTAGKKKATGGASAMDFSAVFEPVKLITQQLVDSFAAYEETQSQNYLREQQREERELKREIDREREERELKREIDREVRAREWKQEQRKQEQKYSLERAEQQAAQHREFMTTLMAQHNEFMQTMLNDFRQNK